MIKVEINNLKKYPVSKKIILDTVKVAGRLEKKIKGTVEINLVSEKEMKEFNYVWRGRNRITDVLSFAWQEDKIVRGDFLGQIFIAFPQIVKQAKEYKVSIKEEFCRMLAHGLLHLVGYEHNKEKDAKQMLVLQEKIINRQMNKR